MAKKLPFGPVMIDLEGLELTAYDKEKISHPNTGAVILFARNFAEPEQVTELINSIRAARNGSVLLAVDQEGGRVQRFLQGFTRLPPASIYSNYPKEAEPAGWLMAAELLAVGIDFSFAPVLDVDCGISEIIGNRSFSQNCESAAQLASQFRIGMNQAGMAAVGKHFPGHGAIALDSHLALPVDERDLDKIRNKDIIPFKYLIDEGLEGIMPSHVVYPEIDSLPAGFSPVWIRQILRKELGFDGAVFSDDLSMEGAASVGSFVERSEMALQAGCDMILVCNNPEAAEQVLEATPIKQCPIRAKRLIRMQGKHQLNLPQLLKSDHWRQVSSRISRISETCK